MNSIPWRNTGLVTGLILLANSPLCAPNIAAQTTPLPSRTAAAHDGKASGAVQGALGEKPKGWYVPTPGYSAVLVAEGAKPGQNSVLLQSEARASNKAAFGNVMRSFNAQPFRGKKLRFRVSAKFAGMGEGNEARIWMRVDRAGKAGMGFFDNQGDHPITANTWKPYEIVGEIDADAQYLNIGFMLLGNGKAWMSDVAVEVEEGKSWTPVPAEQLTMSNAPTVKLLEPAREKELVKELQERAIPITTVEAGHGFEDLAPLDKIVGEARIVALGEASHGTREFFQMKHRMLEYLVNKKGFTVFAIEANWPEAEVADRYIKTGEGNPTAALDAMYFWTWHTREVADMIEWMRNYNKQPGDHPILTFTGFDMQTPDVAAKQVLDYFARADKADLDTVQKALIRFNPAHLAERRNSTPEMLAEDQKRAAGVRKLLDEKRAMLIQATSEAAFNHARQCAQVVLQAATMNIRDQNSYGVRDRSMAENVRWLAEEAYPNQKIVLWAHNGHVGDGSIVGAESMGHHLRTMFGSKMVIFGFGFDFGEIRALTLKDNQMITGPIPQKVPPAMAGSAEALLRQGGSSRYLLDFRTIPPTSPLGKWLAEDQLLQEPGAAYSPDDPAAMFAPLTLSKTFDGLIFIRESHASQLLPYGIPPKKQEKP